MRLNNSLYISVLICLSAITIAGSAIVLWFPNIQIALIEYAQNEILHRPFNRDLSEVFGQLHNSAKYLIICIAAFWLISGALIVYNKLCKKGALLQWFSKSVKTHYQQPTSDRYFLYFAVLVAAFVWLIAFARAANTGMTWDESFTYNYYVHINIFYASLPTAQSINNHLLNTFLIRVFDFLTNSEYSEMIIRLPNLLFGAVYLFFAYKLSANFRYSYLLFLLFACNYYVNEYFSLARGYGMSAACLMATFYFFLRYRNDPDSKRWFALTMLFATLAALAHAISLYVILALLILFVLRYHKNVFTLSNYLPISLFLFCGLSTYFGAHIMPVDSSSSLIISIKSIAAMFIDSKQTILAIAIIICYCAIAGYSVYKTRKLGDFLSIFLIWLAIATISDLVLHKGFPHGREMVPLYPLIVLVFAEATQRFNTTKIAKTAAALFACIIAIQFIFKIDTSYNYAIDYQNHIKEEAYQTAMKINDPVLLRESFDQMMIKYDNPTVIFYREKIAKLLKNEYINQPKE